MCNDNSNAMEKKCFLKCLRRFKGIYIDEIITDMHKEISALFKERAKYPEIDGTFSDDLLVDSVGRQSWDMWHVRKSKFSTCMILNKWKPDLV